MKRPPTMSTPHSSINKLLFLFNSAEMQLAKRYKFSGIKCAASEGYNLLYFIG